MGLGQIPLCRHMLWVQLQNFIEVFDRFSRLVLTDLDDAQVEITFHGFGKIFDYFSEFVRGSKIVMI